MTYVRVLKIKRIIGKVIVCEAVSDGKENSKILIVDYINPSVGGAESHNAVGWSFLRQLTKFSEYLANSGEAVAGVCSCDPENSNWKSYMEFGQVFSWWLEQTLRLRSAYRSNHGCATFRIYKKGISGGKGQGVKT